MSSSVFDHRSRTSDEAKAAQAEQIAADLRQARDEWRVTAQDITEQPRFDLFHEFAQTFADGTAARLELISDWLEHEAKRFDERARHYQAHADGEDMSLGASPEFTAMANTLREEYREALNALDDNPGAS